MDERRQQNEQLRDDVTMLKVLVSEARDDTKELKKFLMGNGTPGIVEKLDDRIRGLEEWKWWVMGVIGTFGFLATSIEVYAHFVRH